MSSPCTAICVHQTDHAQLKAIFLDLVADLILDGIGSE